MTDFKEAEYQMHQVGQPSCEERSRQGTLGRPPCSEGRAGTLRVLAENDGCVDDVAEESGTTTETHANTYTAKPMRARNFFCPAWGATHNTYVQTVSLAPSVPYGQSTFPLMRPSPPQNASSAQQLTARVHPL